MNDQALPAEARSQTVTPLAMQNIKRQYKQSTGYLSVLDGVNLTICESEMVALVAPSGAGKSTLLQIAGLLEQPDAGEIYINGNACAALNDDSRTTLRRVEIGFVYQSHHLLPEFDAVENLVLPQLIRGISPKDARERAMQVMDYLKIAHRHDHRPAELSGGEQQRVAIARAVINGPRLLLADEPTGNLDPQTSQHVFDALMALVRGSGVGALIATHNMALADKMDRQVTLKGGQIVNL